MTYSDYRKPFKQLKAKQPKLRKYMKHNAPKKRTTGVAKKKCITCGRTGRGFISAYKLKLCRQCFRDMATKIGFKKYS